LPDKVFLRAFFNREGCLEVIILEGDGEEIKKFVEAMKIF